jgi:hypothetical protein
MKQQQKQAAARAPHSAPMPRRDHSGHRGSTGPTSPWALSSPSPRWFCGAGAASPDPYAKEDRDARFDRDILDIDALSDGSSVSNLSQEEEEQGERESIRSFGQSQMLVVDVLGGLHPPDSTDEEVILAPNVHKLPECSLVRVMLQSNTEKVTMYCSSDILKMKSPFFGNILLEQEQCAASEPRHLKSAAEKQAMWRSPIVLAESFPYEGAALLERMHENYLLSALVWNSTFCRLSVVWALDEFIDSFAQIIDAHFDKCITFIKTCSWRTNARLLEGMDIAVFSTDLGEDPVLLTGKIVAPDNKIEYSCIRCAIDTSGVASSPNKFRGSSPVFTDTEMHSCVSMTAGSVDSVPGTPITLDQRHYSGDPLVVNVKEPFWVRSDGTKWISPDIYCQLKRDYEVAQTDKRKFWEMLKLLHELPVLNKRCKNRLRTADQVAALFKRKEFCALWSAEAPDCLTADALMCLVSALFDY